MAKSYRPVRRDQPFLLPPDMREWLPADHVVWFLLETVEALDTSAFHVDRRTGGVGTAGYDPDMLLALLIYAYCQGIRSSRQIERRCLTDVAFRVLCAQDVPDHATTRTVPHGSPPVPMEQSSRVLRARRVVQAAIDAKDKAAADEPKDAAFKHRKPKHLPNVVANTSRRTKPALNAFAITFADRFPAAETY